MNVPTPSSAAANGFAAPVDKHTLRLGRRSIPAGEGLGEIGKPHQPRPNSPVPVTLKGLTDAVEEQPADLHTVPRNLLSIDIGGTKIKALVTGQTEPRKALSGRRMTPSKMVDVVRQLAAEWEYDAVSIGYPGLVGQHGPRSEPGNLGSGWVGFDFAAAFEKPVRIINDASMQALGSYEGGRMLFLGLGTGLGSALIANGSIVSLELGRIPHGESNLGDLLGRKGLAALGKKAWRELLAGIVPILMSAFVADYVVLGGGNSKLVRGLPPGARLGHNLTAFRGGFRLWHLEDLPTLNAGTAQPAAPVAANWRMV